MLDWGCGGHNRGHQPSKWKHPCSCKKKKFYSSPDHFKIDKSRRYFKKKKCYQGQRKAYLKRKYTPMKKEKCFIYGKKGHWENKFPKRNCKPKLVVLFDHTLDPEWWDIEFFEDTPPTGEVYILSNEECPPFTTPPSNTKPLPFASSFQNPFLDNSESSSSDSDLELGGCEYNCEYLS